MIDPIFEGLDQPMPDHMGYFLNALLNPPPQDGPPYVHTFQQPEPVPLLDDDGLPILDDGGEPVTATPILPSYTVTDWSTPEGFAATFGEPVNLVPHRPRKPKKRKRRKR